MAVDRVHVQLSCRECGHPHARAAVTCSSCGMPLRVVKDRSLAILLAVLFSFLTWSYTYARNWSKFWIGLLLTALGSLLSLSAGGWIALCFAVWIWAVVDAASKPTDYYLRFPERWRRSGDSSPF